MTAAPQPRRFAIATPTGNIGRKLVHRLLEEEGQHELVLLARKPERLAKEKAPGVLIAQGDLEDADYVRRATEGAEALFWLVPLRLEQPDLRAYYRQLSEQAAAAVRANGIDHVVALSGIGAHWAADRGPSGLLHEIEEALRGAAPRLTILRPAYHMENFFQAIDGILHAGSIFLPVSGSTTTPMVATRDVAQAAAEALLHPPEEGEHIRGLYGPRDYSFEEAARIIGDAVGREVQHVRVPPAQLCAPLIEAGASREGAAIIAMLYENIENGTLVPEPPRSEESTTPTTLEEFAREAFVPALLQAGAIAPAG